MQGFFALKELKRLKTIYLYGTRVSKGGVADLKKALPEAYIIY
jgi:hypothetical protein